MDQERPSDQPGSPPEPPATPSGAWPQPAAPPPATPPTPPPPAWGQPPPVAPPPGQAPMGWAPEPPAAAGAFVRSGEVTAAAIILLVLGAFGLLAGAFVLLAGSLLTGSGGLVESQTGFEDSIPLMGALGGAIAIFGVILLVYSLAYIAAGWGGLRGRDWARVLGVVVAIIGILFWLLGLTGSGTDSGGGGGVVFALIVLAAHAWILFAYAARWRRA